MGYNKNNTVLFTLVFSLCLLNGVTNAYDTKLVIDHDGGADDAMAIFMALQKEKYFNGPKVVAITTVHGNVDEPQVYENTKKILSIANRKDIPIYRGAKTALVKDVPTDYHFGKDGLGDNDDIVYEEIVAKPEIAAFAIINLSKKYPSSLKVVTLGPLTNIALVMKLDPDFIVRTEQIYVAGSEIYSPSTKEVEFNVKMDVEAFDIVIKIGSPNKLTLVPSTQVKMYLNLGVKWRREVFGTIDTKIVKALNKFERKSMVKTSDWRLLDPAVMAVVLVPSIALEINLSKDKTYVCGKMRGRTITDFNSQSPNSRVIYSLDKHAYKEILIKFFSADNKPNDDDNNNNDIVIGVDNINDLDNNSDHANDDDNDNNNDSGKWQVVVDEDNSNDSS